MGETVEQSVRSPLYRSVIPCSILVSVPDPKPTPTWIAFSITCVLYWKWIHAGWGLGTRLAQYLQLAGRLFLCPLSPEKRAFHDSVAHSLASPWISSCFKMFHLVSMISHSNISTLWQPCPPWMWGQVTASGAVSIVTTQIPCQPNRNHSHH